VTEVDRGRTHERVAAIDWLKFASIVAVIVTHAGAAPFPGSFGYTAWDTVLRLLLPSFHVPCLLMISGFLYYRPHPIGFIEVATRLRRILVPYILASLIVFALRPAEYPTLGSKLEALVTADALSIYYYVFLLSLFVVLLPVWSRMTVPMIRGVVAASFVVLAVQSAISWRWSYDFRWAMRNPIEMFTLGYFLIGWLAAASSRQGRVTVQPRQYAAMLVLAGLWPVCIAAGSPYPAINLPKIFYSVAIWQTAWRYVRANPAPRIVREISDATYGIYLYHFLFMAPLYGWTGSWSPPLRILLLTTVGLAGGLALRTVTRSLAGPQRSRDWFGY
jgi:peptidoglycan/LPS O-acetylase OafA/YrhL